MLVVVTGRTVTTQSMAGRCCHSVHAGHAVPVPHPVVAAVEHMLTRASCSPAGCAPCYARATTLQAYSVLALTVCTVAATLTGCSTVLCATVLVCSTSLADYALLQPTLLLLALSWDPTPGDTAPDRNPEQASQAQCLLSHRPANLLLCVG